MNGQCSVGFNIAGVDIVRGLSELIDVYIIGFVIIDIYKNFGIMVDYLCGVVEGWCIIVVVVDDDDFFYFIFGEIYINIIYKV